MRDLINKIKNLVLQTRIAVAQYGVLPWFTSKANGSIGRNAFTVVFFTCLIKYWFVATNPPETLMTAFYTLLGYNVGSKFFDGKKNRDAAVAAGKSMQTIEPVSNEAQGNP